jgi:serine/threonine protein kinase
MRTPKNLFRIVYTILTYFILEAACNHYTGLLLTEDYFKNSNGFGLNPYYESDIMYNPKCNQTMNFFREIILPFTSRNYRLFNAYGNLFYNNNGVDPINVYLAWRKTEMDQKYHIVQFVTSGRKSFVARICKTTKKCYVIHIEFDPEKHTQKAWKEIKHLRKEKFILKARKIVHVDKITLAMFEHMSTSLEAAINHDALGQVQKINLTYELLEMAQSYMEYKIVHGDIHPSKILLYVDQKETKPTRYKVTRPVKIFKGSELDVKLTGFKKYCRLVDENGNAYEDKIYKEGGGVVDMTDRAKPTRRFLDRYKSGYKPFEIWYHGKNTFGPGADLFALGITIYRMVFNDFDLDFDFDCSNIRKRDCKKKYRQLERRFDNQIGHTWGWERCILEVVQNLTYLAPLMRVSPENNMKNLIKCLNKNKFKFEEHPKT